MTVIDDIKQSKAYILGVVAFATAVAGFLTQALHFRTEPTILVVAGFSFLILYIGFLIKRSEDRQEEARKKHRSEENQQMTQIMSSLNRLEEGSVENQRAITRVEMNDLIAREPHNHDTIIAYAERYFISLRGDWKQTDRFLNWVESENKQGRPVHVPEALFTNVQAKYARERAETR